MDQYSLTAEHMQNAIIPVTEYITPVINRILNNGEIPTLIKEGSILPIHKKGKAANDLSNYRGITITLRAMKILDKILLLHQKQEVQSTHHLQYGFTEGRSWLGAAVLLTENIAEASDLKITLFVAVMDVQKAFDVVNHESLLVKYSNRGLL